MTTPATGSISLEQLAAINAASDAAIDTQYDGVAVSHQVHGITIDSYSPPVFSAPQTVLKSTNAGMVADRCSCCGDLQYIGMDYQEGKEVPVCRGCIIALRMASLKHRNPGRLCMECRYKYDVAGLPVGVSHVLMPIEDSTVAEVDVPGLRTLAEAGRIHWDADSEVASVVDAIIN